jgi:VWFA-related protein
VWLAACALLAARGDAAAVTARINRIEAAHFPTIGCYVSVTDETGESLTGLPPGNFTVLEDGEPVGGLRVSSVLPGHEKIAVVLVLDRSGSMRGEPIAAAKKAAADFIPRVSDEDLLGLVTFSTKVDPSVGLTTDRGIPLEGIDRAKTRGETALYDAVGQAIAKLSWQKADRKAVVVLTDGHDNASSATASQCATAARRDNVSIYCVGLGRSLNADALQLMARESGGHCFLTSSADNLTDIYRRIARQIESQYVLTYDSPRPAAEESWRTVKVSVRDRGTEGGDQRQYVAPARTVGHSTLITEPSFPLIYSALVAFFLLDLLLAIALIRRRSKGTMPERMQK